LVLKSGYYSAYWLLGEFEVYGAPGGTPDAVPQASFVVTSDDGLEHTNGWPAVDGDTNTVWVGKAGAGGWYISVGYDPTATLSNLVVDLTPDSLTNIQYLYSLDATNWVAWTPAPTNAPVQLNYLWLVFPTNNTPAVPKVREIWLR
ncbi:MAG: hypothetical protein NTV49_00435, partial [Kiritimatiellaeota bacterium]|nr:hypothetical protein [Kiritimatiellota bacterium]